MKITEIRLGLARTLVPPGGDRYQPVKLDAGLTVTLDDGDDPAKVRAQLQVDLRGLLEETYLAQVKPRPQQRSEPVSRVGQDPAPGGFKPAEPEY